MKEATGELNMTVITVIAIAAVAGLFYAFVWPMIQQRIIQGTCDSMGAGYKVSTSGGDGCIEAKSDDAGGKQYFCCPK